MRISQNLPQFNKEKALIIVASEKDAEFYIATNGSIIEIKEFRISRPKYTESEKRFRAMVKNARSGVVRTESIYEIAKEKVEANFLREFKKTIKQIISQYKIDSLYIFSSTYTIGDVLKNLPASAQWGKKFVRKGNFHKKHPFKLLEMIQAQKPGKLVLTSEEAKKILNGAKKARKVIKS